MRKKIFIFFILLSLLYIKPFSEISLNEFGQKTNHVILFTASLAEDGSETNAVKQLKQLHNYFETHTPPMTVIIAITPAETNDLPDNIPVKKNLNTKNIIKFLNEYSLPVVILLEDGNEKNIEITAGAEKFTSPQWLFSCVYRLCQKENTGINFDFHNFLLYRIGIINKEPLLGEYLKIQIPAIKLNTNKNIVNMLSSIPEVYKDGIPQRWDKHYLVKNIMGKIYIIREKVLVYTIIIVITIGLLFLFAVNSPFYKVRDSYLTSRLVLWIIPISFFIIIFISMFISTKIVSLLFFIKFKNFNSINLLPLTASCSKFLIGLSLIFLFLAFNNILNIRPTQFICGYMSNIICLINIFVFSYINFSLSLLFLQIYVISFFAYRIKNIFIQFIFSIIIIIPIMPYIIISFYNPEELLNLFFKGSNFILSMGLLPIILLYNKLLLRIGNTKIDKKFKSIVSSIIFFIGSLILSSVLIFAVPIWTKNNPMEIIVYQSVYKNNISTKIDSPIKLPNNIKTVLRKVPNTNSKSFFADIFGATDISFLNYSERHVTEISTISKLNNKAIQINIKSDEAFPVYESNFEFQRGDDKQNVEFIFPQNPPNPFLLSFTSSKNSDLDIIIKRWSYENIFDTQIENLNMENIKIRFILEVIETFNLSDGVLIK